MLILQTSSSNSNFTILGAYVGKSMNVLILCGGNNQLLYRHSLTEPILASILAENKASDNEYTLVQVTNINRIASHISSAYCTKGREILKQNQQDQRKKYFRYLHVSANVTNPIKWMFAESLSVFKFKYEESGLLEIKGHLKRTCHVKSSPIT